MENLPQYRKLYEVLRKRILTGVYLEGDLLPSENELCAAYEMTRPTVRHAFVITSYSIHYTKLYDATPPL